MIISIDLITPQEMQHKIAQKVREKRLALDLSQATLSARSGVSYSVIKKFESTGQISLASLLKLAIILGEMEAFNTLFSQPASQIASSLDALMQTHHRKRGRK